MRFESYSTFIHVDLGKTSFINLPQGDLEYLVMASLDLN